MVTGAGDVEQAFGRPLSVSEKLLARREQAAAAQEAQSNRREFASWRRRRRAAAAEKGEGEEGARVEGATGFVAPPAPAQGASTLDDLFRGTEPTSGKGVAGAGAVSFHVPAPRQKDEGDRAAAAPVPPPSLFESAQPPAASASRRTADDRGTAFDEENAAPEAIPLEELRARAIGAEGAASSEAPLAGQRGRWLCASAQCGAPRARVPVLTPAGAPRPRDSVPAQVCLLLPRPALGRTLREERAQAHGGAGLAAPARRVFLYAG